MEKSLMKAATEKFLDETDGLLMSSSSPYLI